MWLSLPTLIFWFGITIFFNLGFPDSYTGIIYLLLRCLYNPADERLSIIGPIFIDPLFLRRVTHTERQYHPFVFALSRKIFELAFL